MKGVIIVAFLAVFYLNSMAQDIDYTNKNIVGFKRIQTENQGWLDIQLVGVGSSFKIHDNSNAGNFIKWTAGTNYTEFLKNIYLPTTSKLGIGTNIPSTQLDIFSNSFDALKLKRGSGVGGVGFLMEDGSGNNAWKVAVGVSQNFSIYKATSQFGSQFVIIDNGNVGIGTSSPSAKLDVAGNIKAQEIEVALASMQDLNLNGTLAANNITYTANGQTADHVFEEDYNLRSLEEIEAFILENKHLPDVPSAAAMEEEGVNLAEMNKLLLQKVEELTLYILKQNEKVITLEDRLDILEGLRSN